MNLEYFIARRIYASREGGRRMSPAVRIAVAGVALGMTVMTLSVAIITGFKQEVRNKVIGFGSHIRISNLDSNVSYETSPVVADDSLLSILSSVPGIKHIETYATKPGLLKTASDNQGIVLKGIDENFDWTFFRSNLKEGDTIALSQGVISSQALISRYLSKLLNLKSGDSFLAYFVMDNVRARKFTVAGIYETGFEDYDKFYVLADIRQIRRLNNWDDDEVSGLEIMVDDYERLDDIADDIVYALSGRADSKGNTLSIRSIHELNPMIFGWLDVLDTNVGIILVLMTAVAGFTMISGLLVIILERIQMIGILKAMGETNERIRKIFLYLAFFLIGKGMLWGNVIGIILCIVQARFHVLKLDAATYYLDAVPISLNLQWILLLNVGSMTVSMLMMLAPSRIVATVEPAKTIRFE
ncbi:MAG: ABC transporter permease [Tannerellaceae bacterium]|nr:ABC transporter permease [Tannerellaceae bacterium]